MRAIEVLANTDPVDVKWVLLGVVDGTGTWEVAAGGLTLRVDVADGKPVDVYRERVSEMPNVRDHVAWLWGQRPDA